MAVASAKKRPNILILMPDQLRPDWIGPGNPGGARTPNVDALMVRGLTFDNAVCPSPICGPSRASLATGWEYDRCTVPNNAHSVGLDEPNMYRQLAVGGLPSADLRKARPAQGGARLGQRWAARVGGRSRLRTARLQRRARFRRQARGDHGASRRGGRAVSRLLQSRGLAEAHVADFATRRNPDAGRGRSRSAGGGRKLPQSRRPPRCPTMPTRTTGSAITGSNWSGEAGGGGNRGSCR